MKKILVLSNIFLLLITFGYSVSKEETNLKKYSFYLKLNPVDPRSLIQGDYMNLDYQIINDSYKDLKNLKKGYIKIYTDEQNIGHYMDVQNSLTSLSKNEKLIYFIKNYNTLDIGANSFFFQEGQRYLFQNAKYAEVIILKNGKLRLKYLLDKNLKIIKTK